MIKRHRDIRQLDGDKIGRRLFVGQSVDVSYPFPVVIVGPEGDSVKAFMWERGYTIDEGGEPEHCMVSIVRPIKEDTDSDDWNEWKRLWRSHYIKRAGV